MALTFRSLFLGTLLGLCTLSACQSDECAESTAVLARVSFYDQKSQREYTVDSLTVVGLRQGVPIDSLLYNQESRTYLLLPLRPESEQTQYLLTIQRQGVIYRDTLTLTHRNRPYFLAPECDCMVYHSIQELHTTNHLVKESKIYNSEVTNQDQEHLVLLF